MGIIGDMALITGNFSGAAVHNGSRCEAAMSRPPGGRIHGDWAKFFQARDDKMGYFEALRAAVHRSRSAKFLRNERTEAVVCACYQGLKIFKEIYQDKLSDASSRENNHRKSPEAGINGTAAFAPMHAMH